MINIYITIPVTLLVLSGGGGLILYFVKNPDKLEKWVAILSKLGRYFSVKAEETYVKYSVQSKVNGFIYNVAKVIPNLIVQKVKVEWVSDRLSEREFIENNQVVVRMRKSRSENRNIVNATVAFVSHSLLIKAKRYIAKYQKEAIDMFTVTQILKREDPIALSEFIEAYLHEAMDNQKVNALYAKFEDIDLFGLYFPVFITEMTFLGEKVFGGHRNDQAIFEEVNQLVNFLYNYSHRKINEDSVNEYNGAYCKFAIRIYGRSARIQNEGEQIYINNIEKTAEDTDTIYIISKQENRDFISSVVKEALKHIPFTLYNNRQYNATITAPDGGKVKVKNILIVLRSKNVAIFRKE